jgi:hypothetical protein
MQSYINDENVRRFHKPKKRLKKTLTPRRPAGARRGS